MKSVKDKIVYFTYQRKVDERNNKLLLQEIKEMREDINSRKLNGLFISLQNVTYDLNSLKELVKSLHNIRKTIDAPICLGEFTTLIYKILKKETKETHIKLFKTFGLAKLFLNTENFKRQLKILMFNDGEDEKELDKQASILTRYEHNILYTKDAEEFKQKITDTNIDFAVNQTKINLTEEEKK